MEMHKDVQGSSSMREESEEETMSHKDEEVATDVEKKGRDVGQLWEALNSDSIVRKPKFGKQSRSRTGATNGPIL